MFFDGEVLGKPKGQYIFLPQRVEFRESAKNYFPRTAQFFEPNAIEIYGKYFSKNEDYSMMRKRPGKKIFYIRKFSILTLKNWVKNIWIDYVTFCFGILGRTIAFLGPLQPYFPRQSGQRIRIPTVDSRAQGKVFYDINDPLIIHICIYCFFHKQFIRKLFCIIF